MVSIHWPGFVKQNLHICAQSFRKTKQNKNFQAIPNWDQCPQLNADMKKKTGIDLVDPTIQESNQIF